MRAIAISLSAILIVFSISGCSQKEIIKVPQKCKIPHTLQPIIDNQKYSESKDIVAKALKNYLSQKEYAEKLLKAQSVCE